MRRARLVVRYEFSQFAEKAATRIHAGQSAPRRLILQSSLEFEIARAGSHSSQTARRG